MPNCWWCFGPSANSGCPVNSSELGDSRQFKMTGWFCHPRCVKAFAVLHASLDPIYKMAPTLTDLFYGERVTPAPWPYKLLDFGGDINRAAWKNLLNSEGSYKETGWTHHRAHPVHAIWDTSKLSTDA
ncbi:hypothetical protein [Singapore grouper iridovirus]|uniref:Uncharacterized protein n=1 Tax=Grouper iridovirus TaxID=127569 RepID=Q5GAE7_9VIRU|nr:unknown protein [Grouper iridovirus]WRW24676.1 hypothetical protein [Singapore grouper iridovirus]